MNDTININCPCCGATFKRCFSVLKETKCPVCSGVKYLPSRISNYILLQRLSKNDYYSTYKGLNTDSNQEVCLKLFNPELISANHFKELEVKSKAAGALLKFAFLEEKMLLLRPWFPVSLEAYLSQSRPRASKVLHIFKYISDELHRKPSCIDLRLGNLLIDDMGKVVLSDFALRECLLEACNAEPVRLGMAEKSKNKVAKKDLQTTLFSCGLLFAEVLSGERKTPQQARALNNSDLSLREDIPSSMAPLVAAILKEKIEDFSQLSDYINTIIQNPTVELFPEEAPSVKPQLAPLAVSANDEAAQYENDEEAEQFSALTMFGGVSDGTIGISSSSQNITHNTLCKNEEPPVDKTPVKNKLTTSGPKRSTRITAQKPAKNKLTTSGPKRPTRIPIKKKSKTPLMAFLVLILASISGASWYFL
ncbi:MAG: hypothetical protein HRT88_21360 [Lentisphaeraceae bacterium]|nr:hypothetical protein [Lentisphaeraceae bacterium]